MSHDDFLPGDATLATLAALGELPDDAPVVMLNLLEYANDDGAEYRRYGRIALPQIERRGGKVLYSGVPLSDDATAGHWDQVVIVYYPTRAAFLDMMADPDYQAGSRHRTAGLKRTELHAFKQHATPNAPPLEPIARAGAAKADDEIFVLNLLSFKPDGGRGEYRKYAEAVRPMITQRSGAPVLILDGELPLVSDQTWGVMYLVRYPSIAALEEMVASSAWQTANEDRQRGLDLTWAVPTQMSR